MSTPEKPGEKTPAVTPPQQIGTVKVRVEEGLTQDTKQNGDLSDADLDGVSGGIAATNSRLKPE